MKRNDIIEKIGKIFFTSNLEADEFSYSKALKSIGKNIKDYQNSNETRKYKNLDMRFANDRLTILVETKKNFSLKDMKQYQEQLSAYVRYEKEYSENKIVAILAETEGEDVWVWYGGSVIIDDIHRIVDEKIIKDFEYYENIYFGKVNNKNKVINSTKKLNEKLHSYGIREKLRSQFVGTCLLALKNGLVYKGVKDKLIENGKTISKKEIIINDIKSILEGLLVKNLNKAEKLAILNRKVLEDQFVLDLSYDELKEILSFIENEILPHINDKNTAGQDLLNLFFTTFNKFVGKDDKNQAFTPDHICSFMSKAIGINKNSRVLDPCCGSGAFLVRAMTDIMDDCDTEEEREKAKERQVYGIEVEETAFGLATTNMLIHGDGNSNIVLSSMFDKAKWIQDANINAILMNPPYNATRKSCSPEYVKTWKSKKGTKAKDEDPTKGLHFVEWIARHVSKPCKLAVLLPMQVAKGDKGEIAKFKKKMLDNYTLDAVFSLPIDIFYPGANAIVCCMIFDLSQKHSKSDKKTFFGYFRDDGLEKRKGLGRVEKLDSDGIPLWQKIEKKWLDLYRNKKEVAGLSVMQKVGADDEWFAEAYMDIDYSTLSKKDFQITLNNYLSYLVKNNFVKE
ncbi:type IIB restriction/modification system, restriction/methyltransferase subunit [Campylobacter lari]|uniref:HsdM family class I SAM-dependent methyltransferase n=1 Tax=Campylobacter TaxID=194 RepID=UPI002152EAA8|nr:MULTISPECIES: SAM-dependent methyltransferase [Campylobacter]MCR6516510.1 SAM-dependent methyltransferase [Campylobacter lari]MCV3456388.1 SAM-dependent methyltransferase [Campylobacter sp. CNRCH_2016_0050h]